MSLLSFCTEAAQDSRRACEQPPAAPFRRGIVRTLCIIGCNDLAVLTAAMWAFHLLLLQNLCLSEPPEYPSHEKPDDQDRQPHVAEAAKQDDQHKQQRA